MEDAAPRRVPSVAKVRLRGCRYDEGCRAQHAAVFLRRLQHEHCSGRPTALLLNVNTLTL